MKESDIIEALHEIEWFFKVVTKALTLPKNGDTAKGLKGAVISGDKAEKSVLSLCKYVANNGDKKRLLRLKEFEEKAASLMLEEWPLSDPLKGWQARYSILKLQVETIQATIQNWVKNMPLEDEGSNQDVQINEEGIRALFNEHGSKMADSFVANLKKAIEGGETIQGLWGLIAKIYEKSQPNPQKGVPCSLKPEIKNFKNDFLDKVCEYIGIKSTTYRAKVLIDRYFFDKSKFEKTGK